MTQFIDYRLSASFLSLDKIPLPPTYTTTTTLALLIGIGGVQFIGYMKCGTISLEITTIYRFP